MYRSGDKHVQLLHRFLYNLDVLFACQHIYYIFNIGDCYNFGQLQYNEILTFFNLCKGNEITWFEILEKIDQGSQIGQIWRILCQNCSDDSTEVI